MHFRDTVVLAFTSEGTSFFSGMAVFAILGYMASYLNLPIDQVVQSGPGLGFIAYPEALSLLPLPNLWSVLFFIMLLTVALDSMFVTVETVSSAILDGFPALRKRQILVNMAVCILFFFLGLPMCTQAGIYIFQLIDWYIVAFATTFVFTMISYKPPNYGTYIYPGYAQVIGWSIASIPIIPIPVYIVIQLKNAPANSLYEMSAKFNIAEKKEGSIEIDTSFETVDSSESSGYERETWARKTEYLLSMIGYSVGLGNIWRFPYICLRNGGGAFLIPYLFFLITCGIPLYFLEVSVSQFLGKGVVYFSEVAPIFRGLGFGMAIASVFFAFYYNIITNWILYYIVNSFFNPLPWSTCENSWNSKYCVDERHKTSSNMAVNTTLDRGIQPALTIITSNTSDDPTGSNTHLIIRQVLQMSSGLHDIGYFPWHLPVVYITATLPYLLLTVLIIRGLTLPGGIDGIAYYYTPKFERLIDKQVWLEAVLQVFYSLGPCWGALITMSSYTKFTNNCLRDAVILSLVSEGTSLYGGMAVFVILGYMANNLNLPIDQVVQSGPGLGFMAYPEALSLLPLPNLWSVLFFIMLLTLALDTLAGIYIFQLIDWYIAAFAVTFFGVLECIIYGWIYAFNISTRHVTFVFTMLEYSPPNYGTYIYPGYAQYVLLTHYCIKM
ncbi:hypothetical protein KUTeg_001953 [Tegillarca granosa]|uniref:Transporter n=1 Tax=Tegillarca granosa TaxID=220873 RepID=A0ABQ9FW35_TEGGR|nr:hypothetical protein KUTeg_001953 [Tegillarca granosa]